MRLRALPIAFIAACGGDLATPDGCADHTWSCAEVEAAVAAAYGDATISCADGAETFTISSDGVPLYTSNQTTPNDITAQNYAIEIPMTATCASSAEDITDSRGPTAIAITGIVLFGPADALGRDAIEYEGPTMDDCWGHAAPGGVYHHHSEPVCAFGTDTDPSAHRTSDGHPPLLAFSYDGFGIYAIDDGDPGGADLDACSGHVDDVRGYHYHMTETYPYTFGCYAGTPLR